jgi:cobalt-zinc-cadmium efflux system membrane fusion protein
MKQLVLMIFLAMGVLSSLPANSNENNKHSREDEHNKNLSTHISKSMANEVGIQVTKASAHNLRQSNTVYGTLATAPDQISHVRARFTGMIQSVNVNIGDTVSRGDLLVEVESNESLKIYPIRAPISGTVISREANIGEVTQNQVLLTIANLDALWAEFRIYPTQQTFVQSGQPVYWIANGIEHKAKIQHIIPALDNPYQIARATFDNRNTKLSPGLLVEGRIIVNEFKVELAVEKDAIQTMNDLEGVFVQSSDGYTFKPLKLGRSDEKYIEVLSGLDRDQKYVHKNSYLIKADILKSEVEDHD